MLQPRTKLLNSGGYLISVFDITLDIEVPTYVRGLEQVLKQTKPSVMHSFNQLIQKQQQTRGKIEYTTEPSHPQRGRGKSMMHGSAG